MTADLFAHHQKSQHIGEPLAERMRPRTLEEFVGQHQLLGPGKLLQRLLHSGQPLPSLILWGPPGTGKTTLAQLLAQQQRARFVALSAVQAGVRELRQEVDEARVQLQQYGRRTLLFIDEVHRFNKAQQDALLPHVEAGTVTLIGATTENPSFEINAALLSRCRVLRLSALGEEDLRRLVERALQDPRRGLGGQPVELSAELIALLCREAGGDGRRVLGTLEAAVQVTPPGPDGVRRVDAAALQEAAGRKLLLYDKSGEEHYNVVSAFIKSMRASDAEGAVYWMARMIEAGEDPLFILRRMVIFAAEDVGAADPQALQLAVAAVEAVRFVGLPEGVLPMTQLALHLARAPKDRGAVHAYAAAKEALDQRGAIPVPPHLRNRPHG